VFGNVPVCIGGRYRCALDSRNESESVCFCGIYCTFWSGHAYGVGCWSKLHQPITPRASPVAALPSCWCPTQTPSCIDDCLRGSIGFIRWHSPCQLGRSGSVLSPLVVIGGWRVRPCLHSSPASPVRTHIPVSWRFSSSCTTLYLSVLKSVPASFCDFRSDGAREGLFAKCGASYGESAYRCKNL